MIETDEVLYSRFLTERNEDAFRILLDRHRESLILFLNGYVHHLEDAEDLMLDAYARAAAGTTAFLAGVPSRHGFSLSGKRWLWRI